MYKATINTCQNSCAHFIVDKLLPFTSEEGVSELQSWEEVDIIRYTTFLKPEIEQAKDSISPYKANLEAAGWTDLQDVELCSGRETWGCPPGGVCPRKVVHEDIQPWVVEKLSERLGVWGNAFQQQSHVSAESIREFSYCLSNLQPPLPSEEVLRDFDGGENE